LCDTQTGVSDKYSFSPTDCILLPTAFAAGAVDLISFTTLGGVFASAMTGNFALLAYYVAQGRYQPAVGSVVALGGFVLGCGLAVFQRRGRPQSQAITLLLVTEMALLLFFAMYAWWAPHAAEVPSYHLQVALLAVAMGLQAVIGQAVSLTTIVFTTTLTKLVTTITDSIGTRGAGAFKDVKLQSSVVLSYLFGALLAGTLIVHRLHVVVVLPFIGVVLAFACQRRAKRR